MKKLIYVSCVSISLISSACGADLKGKSVSTKKSGAVVYQNQPSNCVTNPDGSQTCSVTSIPGTIVSVPLGSSTNLGAGVPDSYTFMDTPDANLCVDAFTRAGVVIPPTAVARTLDANSSGVNGGFGIMDTTTTTTPIMNVVHLDSRYSNVTFQFLNRNGFYCIVKNNAYNSNITIQRACTAQMTSLEPIVSTSQACAPEQPVYSGRWGKFIMPFFGPSQNSRSTSPSTNNGIRSSINEVPCVQ